MTIVPCAVWLFWSFQKRLERNQSIKLNRLSEEEMTRCITEGAASPKEWKGRYDSAKARLLTKLSFDVCNEYLEDVKYWLEQTAVHPKQKSTCLRVLYYTVACFLVCLDYVTRNVPLQEPEARKN